MLALHPFISMHCTHQSGQHLANKSNGHFTVPPSRCSLHQFAFGYKFSPFKVTSRYLQFINNLPVRFDVSFCSDGGSSDGDRSAMYEYSRTVCMVHHNAFTIVNTAIARWNRLLSSFESIVIAYSMHWLLLRAPWALQCHFDASHSTNQAFGLSIATYLSRSVCSSNSVGWSRAVATMGLDEHSPFYIAISIPPLFTVHAHAIEYIIIISIYYFQQSRKKFAFRPGRLFHRPRSLVPPETAICIVKLFKNRPVPFKRSFHFRPRQFRLILSTSMLFARSLIEAQFENNVWSRLASHRCFYSRHQLPPAIGLQNAKPKYPSLRMNINYNSSNHRQN